MSRDGTHLDWRRPRRKTKPLLDHPVSLRKPVNTNFGVDFTGAQTARAIIVATTEEIFTMAKVTVNRSRIAMRKSYDGRTRESVLGPPVLPSESCVH